MTSASVVKNVSSAARVGSVSTAAMTAAAPGVGVATVKLVGFGTTGIAANSLAASLMSMSAVANGGGVPAAGVVATLQSIGTMSALATGTVIGMSAIGVGGCLAAAYYGPGAYTWLKSCF